MIDLFLGQDKQPISYADVLSATLRSDLVPVPLSLEFSVQDRNNLTGMLNIGQTLTVGQIAAEFIIIKSQPVKMPTVKDGSRIGAIACVAIPAGLERLIIPMDKAIILQQTSFNAAVRACGGRLALGGDLPLPEFICLKGTLPTVRIARYLQQEAALMGWVNQRIGISKIDYLVSQQPIQSVDPSAVAWIDSERREGIEKSAFVSVDTDGSSILGADTKSGIGTQQAARLDTRQIRNMSKVLIRRGTIMRGLSLNINAGQVLEIDKKSHVILTAAHHIETAALGGQSVAISKFWIGSL